MPSSPPSFGVAVLGFGLAGRVFHAPFVSAVPGLELRSILQRSGDEASQLFPGVQIARSLQEVLSDAAIDLVVVGTPNETHLPFAEAALRAGKHVVVDKPVAPTADTLAQLMALARERGLLLAPFHNRRWDGDYLTVRGLLEDGVLGRLVSFHSRFDRFRPVLRPGTWKETASDAHGILLDLGPHLVDQALALFGIPTEITASVRREREGSAIEDAFDLTLSYPSGTRVVLGSSVIAADPSPRFLLHGTRGSYRKFGVDPQEPTLVAGARVPRLGSPEKWLLEPAEQHGTLTLCEDPVTAPSNLTREQLPTQAGDYRLFYANVLASLCGTEPLVVTPVDAWITLRLLELARESSRTARTLHVAFEVPPNAPTKMA